MSNDATQTTEDRCQCGAMTAIECGEMPGRHCGMWDVAEATETPQPTIFIQISPIVAGG